MPCLKIASDLILVDSRLDGPVVYRVVLVFGYIVVVGRYSLISLSDDINRIEIVYIDVVETT